MIFDYLNDFQVFEWFSSFGMIFEYLNDFRVLEWISNDFRVFEWFSSIWKIFEYLNHFRVFEWFSSMKHEITGNELVFNNISATQIISTHTAV